MSKKKVSFFIPSFDYGGAEKNAVILSNYFLYNNYDVHILVINNNGILKERLNPHIKIINFNKSRSIFSFFQLIKYLNHEKPNIFISTIINLNIISILAKKISRHKFLLILREANVIKYKYSKNFKLIDYISYLCVKHLYRYSDFVVSICEFIYSDLKKLKINSKIIYSPIVNKEIISLSKYDDYEITFNNNDPIILFVGRLEKQKNLTLLIDSFIKINKIKKSNLLIIGNGSGYNEIINQIKNHNLEDSIKILKKTNNVFKFMKLSSLLINTSLWEGLSNVIVESIFLKLPVICTNCPGGNREIIETLGGGKLVNQFNSKIIAQETIKILNNKKMKYNDKNLNVFTTEYSFSEYEKLFKN